MVLICVAVIAPNIPPPTYKFPPMPTPPTTCNAPEFVPFAATILDNVKVF